MKREVLFHMSSPFRDDFQIEGFRFGSGKPALAIVGALRGDEVQQQFICSQMVNVLQRMEASGHLTKEHEILVIPNANHFSMNIEKRFWAMDSTDINRMFPGYDQGETTQRIAAALFEQIKEYSYGIQLASYYLPGDFIPHIRMMETGYQPEAEACWFGLPYAYVRPPRPYDTTVLNYNWQIWGCKAFSLYAGSEGRISETTTRDVCQAILRFMQQAGLTRQKVRAGYQTTLIHDRDLLSIRAEEAGIFLKNRSAGQEIRQGEELARILDPYDGHLRQSILAPADGILFFAHDKPLVLQHTLLFKLVEN